MPSCAGWVVPCLSVAGMILLPLWQMLVADNNEA